MHVGGYQEKQCTNQSIGSSTVSFFEFAAVSFFEFAVVSFFEFAAVSFDEMR